MLLAITIYTVATIIFYSVTRKQQYKIKLALKRTIFIVALIIFFSYKRVSTSERASE